MSQLVRGIAWRRGQTLTLFLLGTVVVAGSLVAARFSDLTDTPPGSVGVLLVLGVVALSVQAAAAAGSRRSEVALAQIRGRRGRRLFAYFLSEPVTVLVLGAAAGVLLGRAVTTWAADRWLGAGISDAGRIGALGWVTVAVALVSAVAAVVAGSWRTLREPLVEQLDASHRPRPAANLVLFGQTMVIVVAVIAAYQASQHAGSRDGWVGIVDPALLSPVLLGLAAGQVAAWGLQAVATLSARRDKEAERLGAFLAVRRMARRSDTVFGARLVIAAAVVTAVTASATTAVHAWQDESTRLALGGPRQYPVRAGALAAYRASHTADPDGRWLMAMMAAPDESERYRRVFADTARWDTVVGDFLGGTAAARISDQAHALQVGTPVTALTGDTLSATFTNASLRATFGSSLTVTYATSDGQVHTAVLTPGRPPTGHGTTTAAASVPRCRQGCVLTLIVIDGLAHAHRRPYLDVTDLRLGDASLLADTRWTIPGDGRSFTSAEQQDGGLTVQLTRYGEVTSLKPATASQRLAVLTTPGLTMERNRKSPIVYAVDGSEHTADVVGQVPALPFVGQLGALIDLPRALAGGGTSIADSAAYVVARDDTPADVLEALEHTGVVGAPRDFGSSLATAEQRADAQGVRLYTLMSLFAALIALVGLVAAVNGQRFERRQEAASLRVAGVRARHIRAAHRREAWWLAVAVFGVVAVAGWVAARLSLAGLSLVPQTAYSPGLQGDPSVHTLLLVAAGAGVLVGVVTLLANRRVAAGARPSMLRDEVGS